MSDSYHHGNLRQALIDAGVRIINERGEEGLSLRGVAAACGVSHAAPYAHFRDKNDLVESIKKSIEMQFTEELSSAVLQESNAESALIAMGRSYVSFFIRKPDYFKFLFGGNNLIAHLQPGVDYDGDYQPFALLKNTYRRYLKEKNLNKNDDEQEMDILKLWASAHGLASLACMSGVKVSFDWEEKLASGELLE